MSMWKCYTCKADMEEVDDIKIHYNDMELPDAPGFRCPVCGIEFMDGDFVVSELAYAEEMLTGK